MFMPRAIFDICIFEKYSTCVTFSINFTIMHYFMFVFHQKTLESTFKFVLVTKYGEFQVVKKRVCVSLCSY